MGHRGLENVHSRSYHTQLYITRGKMKTRTGNTQFSIEIVIICHEELQTIRLRMSNIPSISLFQNTKTKLPFGQLVTRSPTGTSSRSCSETFLAPAGGGGTFPGSAEGMETSQPSFPPSPPSPRTKGEDGGRDRKTEKEENNLCQQHWGLGCPLPPCGLAGPGPTAAAQGRRGSGEEGSLGRRLHRPELPQLPTQIPGDGARTARRRGGRALGPQTPGSKAAGADVGRC